MILEKEEVLDERPVDNAPVGGVKGDNTSTLNIVPFIAETVSTVSPQDMCVSVESQFRQLADVTRSLVISLNKLKEFEVSITERVEALEAKHP